jgi:hypothetical protein
MKMKSMVLYLVLRDRLAQRCDLELCFQMFSLNSAEGASKQPSGDGTMPPWKMELW